MILAQNWPKTAKSSWHCSFKQLFLIVKTTCFRIVETLFFLTVLTLLKHFISVETTFFTVETTFFSPSKQPFFLPFSSSTQLFSSQLEHRWNMLPAKQSFFTIKTTFFFSFKTTFFLTVDLRSNWLDFFNGSALKNPINL